MKKLRVWLASESGKRFFNVAYSLGAAIVIIGAMFKVMHYPGANVIFVTGMVVEAFIFFLSAFDTSLYDNAPVTVGQNIQMSDQFLANKINNIEPTSGDQKPVASSSAKGASSVGGSQVIVVGGGTIGNASPASSAPVATTGTTTTTHSSHTQTAFTSGSVADPSIGNITSESAKGYTDSMASAVQNMEEFSKTMQSLNETSQTLLDAYKQIADANNLSESMNTVRYINDSLSRIKNLYDGAIGDSYMFKEEMSKMTRHIEALNQVYARLLQAMTSNNNSNQNNPPIY